ncbi:Uma2 family endonuclease [Gordonia hydrophobica]|uniref:Uma2 family endonuclease n=1 Tax=Gordonia hydrophobica TaxID=40516 RepID=A0ABZ2TXK6_9ACTN|nr:Uma2 family endonuclease [Gordonia hydrophobica]MBM7366406.1 Uma2 family endonuclease [Gordonia hydrophobica]
MRFIPLIVSPAPKTQHQRAVMRLGVLLFTSCPDDLELLPPFDVALAPDTVIQPDLIIARTADLTDHDLPTAPLLAIEVLSPSTRGSIFCSRTSDSRVPACPHYWTVDPDTPAITARTLVDGQYDGRRSRRRPTVPGH